MTKRLPVILAAAAVAALALVPVQRAAAQQVTVRVDTPEFGFRIGTPIYPAPVVMAPAPIYAPPPVVYAPPPPVVYAPPPRVMYPPVVYGPPRVLVAPRSVYVAPSPVYVAPRWIAPGHRYRYQHTDYRRRGDHQNDRGYRY
jgi:hypothetical protein